VAVTGLAVIAGAVAAASDVSFDQHFSRSQISGRAMRFAFVTRNAEWQKKTEERD